MTSERFRPFGVADEEFEEMLVLKDGVPTLIREPLVSWIFKKVSGSHSLNRELGFAIRTATGVDLGATTEGYVWNDDLPGVIRRLSPLQMLQVTDYLISKGSRHTGSPPNDVVTLFAEGSSKWMPRHDGVSWRLQERVPEGSQEAVEFAIRESPTAGPLLVKAWNAAYGMNPDAGQAYKMAVKAAETALHLLIEPKNSGATLGTMTSVLRNAKGKGWTLPFKERDDHEGANQQTLLLLMQTLWDGQDDRHRDGEVFIDEARAGVHSAATLVAWAAAGYITRPDQ